MKLPAASITKASNAAGASGVTCGGSGYDCWTADAIDGTHHATWRDGMTLNDTAGTPTLDTDNKH